MEGCTFNNALSNVKFILLKTLIRSDADEQRRYEKLMVAQFVFKFSVNITPKVVLSVQSQRNECYKRSICNMNHCALEFGVSR
jgi:hypothetical protein